MVANLTLWLSNTKVLFGPVHHIGNGHMVKDLRVIIVKGVIIYCCGPGQRLLAFSQCYREVFPIMLNLPALSKLVYQLLVFNPLISQCCIQLSYSTSGKRPLPGDAISFMYMYWTVLFLQGVQQYGDKLVAGLCRNHIDPYIIRKPHLWWF
jgi:hypothetical protein